MECDSDEEDELADVGNEGAGSTGNASGPDVERGLQCIETPICVEIPRSSHAAQQAEEGINGEAVAIVEPVTREAGIETDSEAEAQQAGKEPNGEPEATQPEEERSDEPEATRAGKERNGEPEATHAEKERSDMPVMRRAEKAANSECDRAEYAAEQSENLSPPSSFQVGSCPAAADATSGDGEGMHPQEDADRLSDDFADLACSKCGRLDDDDQMILCDGSCGRAFHTFCLDPPLDEWAEQIRTTDKEVSPLSSFVFCAYETVILKRCQHHVPPAWICQPQYAFGVAGSPSVSGCVVLVKRASAARRSCRTRRWSCAGAGVGRARCTMPS